MIHPGSGWDDPNGQFRKEWRFGITKLDLLLRFFLVAIQNEEIGGNVQWTNSLFGGKNIPERKKKRLCTISIVVF